MSKLFKFTRTNKVSGKVEAFVGMPGVITNVNQVERKNKNGKPYLSFNATVNNGEKSNKVSGQVYLGLIPHIGGTPIEGEEYNFVARLDDLKEGYNTRWGIGGTPVDAVMEGLMDDLDALEA